MNAAWGKARVNKPSAGVDGVTWDMYDSASADANKELCQELRDKTYECKPVKLVTIYKEDKERQIALYCMRDKVVQQSLAEELRRMYDGNFSTQTYAYRANKSALLAVAEIDKKISAISSNINVINTKRWNNKELFLIIQMRKNMFALENHLLIKNGIYIMMKK